MQKPMKEIDAGYYRMQKADIGYCALLTLLALALFLTAKVQVLPLLEGPVTFDGKHYLSIFEHGYAFSGNIEEKQNTAYLPLTAGAIGAATIVVPGSNRLVEVMLLGTLVLFGTLLGMFSLSSNIGDEKAARISTLLWAGSPMALYNFVGYSEPIFALLSVWTFIALQRKAFWGAAILVALALLGRPHALALVAFVAFALLRHARWSPLEMLRGPAALQLSVMFVPLMVFASWQALQFNDSIAYINSLEAWRRGSFMDGNLDAAPAFLHFFSAVSGEARTLSHWTTLLSAVSVLVIAGVLALAPAAPKWMSAFYVAMLIFLFATASFDALNIARHTFFMFPWAIVFALAIARLPGRDYTKLAALVPWLLIAATVNFYSVMRYYRGEWVS